MNFEFFRQAVTVFGLLVFPYQLMQLVARPDPDLSPDQRNRKALMMIFFMIFFAQWFVPNTTPWFSGALTLIMLAYLAAALSSPIRRKLFRLEE